MSKRKYLVTVVETYKHTYLVNANSKREAQDVFKRTNISEVQMRFADQKQGYAQGINQALAYIGYSHPDMKMLWDVI